MTIKTLYTIGFLLLTHSAIAGTAISFQGNNQALNSDIYVQNGKVSMTQKMGGASTVSIYDSAKNHFINVNHNNKTYMMIDEAAMKQAMGQVNEAMQQMQAQLAQMPPEQRQMMEQQLKAMGLSSEAPAATKQAAITRTGERKTFKVGNDKIACEVIKIDNTASACITDVRNTAISTSDYATLNKMFEFSRKLAEQASRATGRQALPPNLDGVPLEFKDFRSNTSSRIVNIKKTNISDSLFTVPSGYKQINMSGNQ